MSDPCGEDSHSPVPGLVHRYPDRVLFLVTDRCASYCRYCTRSRLVSNASGYDFHPEYDRQIAYIASHPEVRDVLLSGGDPLLFSDEKLEQLLSRLRAIRHVEFLRIGSRIPIFLPQRITPELCAMLKQYHPLFVSVHVNHPRELTTEVRAALGRLADAGIPLGNQSVLLRQVNDDVVTMKALIPAHQGSPECTARAASTANVTDAAASRASRPRGPCQSSNRSSVASAPGISRSNGGPQ